FGNRSRSGEIATARLLTVKKNLQAAAASRVGLPHGSGTLPSPPDCCTLSAPTADLTPELLLFAQGEPFLSSLRRALTAARHYARPRLPCSRFRNRRGKKRDPCRNSSGQRLAASLFLAGHPACPKK